eukprot:gene11604-13546_t
MHCSHFSAWGSRTLDGSMYSGRNLDWFTSGMSRHKLVAFIHPSNGISHCAVSFAGLLGALTGISSHGLFVAESGSDTKALTFDGFAWTMRLRRVMEEAIDIKEALQFWETTNNTMGMNHMLGAQLDPSEHPAYALETMAGYTAYFPDNDTNEIYQYTDPTTGQETQMGWPMPQAVWRTNNGFDATIRSEVLGALPGPDDNTIHRYNLLRDAFLYQEESGNKISDLEAINITSIAADKNNTNFYSCKSQANGVNILSAVFNAQSATMYVAYEEGTGEARICACCGTYVKIDLSQWFGELSPIAIASKKKKQGGTVDKGIIE